MVDRFSAKDVVLNIFNVHFNFFYCTCSSKTTYNALNFYTYVHQCFFCLLNDCFTTRVQKHHLHKKKFIKSNFTRTFASKYITDLVNRSKRMLILFSPPNLPKKTLTIRLRLHMKISLSIDATAKHTFTN